MSWNKADAQVGVIGLGSMGAGIARCLLRDGWNVHIYARKPEVAAAFAEAGAMGHTSSESLGRACDVVVLSLPDAAAVESVLFGPNGLMEGMKSGSCVIDTSTIAANSAQEFAERLATQQIRFLDAPVSGGQAGAEAGTLAAMVGGAVEDVDACRDLLTAFCQTLTHVGAVGAGQTVKACNQVAVAGAMLGLADALALARAQGVDPTIMREVLLQGSARSFPMEKHAPRIIEQSFDPGFRARLMRKDLRLALETAKASGAALAGAPVVEALLDRMCEHGRGDWDWCGVAMEVGNPTGRNS